MSEQIGSINQRVESSEVGEPRTPPCDIYSRPPEGLILRKIYGREEIRPCRDSRCIRTSFPRFMSQGAKRRRVMGLRYSLAYRLTSEIRNRSVHFVQVARADGWGELWATLCRHPLHRIRFRFSFLSPSLSLSFHPSLALS